MTDQGITPFDNMGFGVGNFLSYDNGLARDGLDFSFLVLEVDLFPMRDMMFRFSCVTPVFITGC